MKKNEYWEEQYTVNELIWILSKIENKELFVVLEWCDCCGLFNWKTSISDNEIILCREDSM